MPTTITLKIRESKQSDFFDAGNKPIYGTIYFLKKVNGEFTKRPYYFTDNTDKQEFNLLYKRSQVFVPVGLFEEVDIQEV